MNPEVSLVPKEKVIVASSGGCCCLLALASLAAGLGVGIPLCIGTSPAFAFMPVLGFLGFLILCCGVFTVNPNEARILTFCGKYMGTIKNNGMFFVNPFYKKEYVSLAANNM